jgi:hypothetical protein
MQFPPALLIGLQHLHGKESDESIANTQSLHSRGLLFLTTYLFGLSLRESEQVNLDLCPTARARLFIGDTGHCHCVTQARESLVRQTDLNETLENLRQ